MFVCVSRMAVLALGLFVAFPVVAAEHTYPGAMCVRTTSSSSNPSPSIDSTGNLGNPSSTATMTVVCPVVGPYNDLSGSAANVFVHDTHLSQNVCCSARANTVGVLKFGPTVCSDATDSKYQAITVTPPSVSGTFTSRFLYCSVPPAYSGARSILRLYRY